MNPTPMAPPLAAQQAQEAPPPQPDGDDGVDHRADPRPQHLPVLTSAALLRGRKSVAIDHNGLLYRLQTTRQGKLILTK